MNSHICGSRSRPEEDRKVYYNIPDQNAKDESLTISGTGPIRVSAIKQRIFDQEKSFLTKCSNRRHWHDLSLRYHMLAGAIPSPPLKDDDIISTFPAHFLMSWPPLPVEPKSVASKPNAASVECARTEIVTLEHSTIAHERFPSPAPKLPRTGSDENAPVFIVSQPQPGEEEEKKTKLASSPSSRIVKTEPIMVLQLRKEKIEESIREIQREEKYKDLFTDEKQELKAENILWEISHSLKEIPQTEADASSLVEAVIRAVVVNCRKLGKLCIKAQPPFFIAELGHARPTKVVPDMTIYGVECQKHLVAFEVKREKLDKKHISQLEWELDAIIANEKTAKAYGILTNFYMWTFVCRDAGRNTTKMRVKRLTDEQDSDWWKRIGAMLRATILLGYRAHEVDN